MSVELGAEEERLNGAGGIGNLRSSSTRSRM